MATNPNGNANGVEVYGGMRSLDMIHYLFLFYSSAHNFINAWHHSGNALFFIFVIVGILSVEIMLWSIYKNWKEGRLVGKMMKVSRNAGMWAMFFACAGILAQTQEGGGGWLEFYYSWILPMSAPMMFYYSFRIQAVDPIMNADRDHEAYAHMVKIETKRGKLDEQMAALKNQKALRQLKSHAQEQRLVEVWREMMSNQARKIMRHSAKMDLPVIMRMIGIKPQAIENGSKNVVARWWGTRSAGGLSSDGHGSADPPELSFQKAQTQSSLVSPQKPVAASHKRSTKGPKRRRCKEHEHGECDNYLSGRQRDFCSPACSQRNYRRRTSKATA